LDVVLKDGHHCTVVKMWLGAPVGILSNSTDIDQCHSDPIEEKIGSDYYYLFFPLAQPINSLTQLKAQKKNIEIIDLNGILF